MSFWAERRKSGEVGAEAGEDAIHLPQEMQLYLFTCRGSQFPFSFNEVVILERLLEFLLTEKLVLTKSFLMFCPDLEATNRPFAMSRFRHALNVFLHKIAQRAAT